jgi:tRNA threonylcarbamoyl adenosine modification protein (Sua5/YciO/YrdC/YwlC family)
MLLKIQAKNPQPERIEVVRTSLLSGGVIIYPTDTVYGLGCDLFQFEAIERICRIKKIDPPKAQFSFICTGLSQLSEYTKSISTPIYRLLKTHLPGPYTFILPASKNVPKIFKSKKNTVGLRIPDNPLAMALVRALDHPMVSTSLPGEIVEEYTDPARMYQQYKSLVDLVIDGGKGGLVTSTVIDCTGPEPKLIRAGLGPWDDSSPY